MKIVFLLIVSMLLVSCIAHYPLSNEEERAKRRLALIDNLPPPPNTEEVQKAVYGELPNNYQEMIKEYMAIFLKDPYSVKYDFRSEPSKGYIQDLEINEGRPTFGWLVFFGYNTKNSHGAYTGDLYTYFFIYKDLNSGNYHAYPTSEYQGDFIFTETK